MCSVNNCNNIANRKGMCSLHYRRQLRGVPLGPSTRLRQSVYHGLSSHPAYHNWEQMIQRCNNPKKDNYHLYGGRGIKVCERWRNFANFIADMGEKPTTKHSIDRIDNDGNYEPSNCKWSTAKEQAQNRRPNSAIPIYEFDGIKAPLSEHCKRKGVKHGTALYRIRHNWGLENIFLPKYSLKLTNK